MSINIGGGAFADAVQVGQSFDTPSNAAPELTYADIDGSGTTDIVVLNASPTPRYFSWEASTSDHGTPRRAISLT